MPVPAVEEQPTLEVIHALRAKDHAKFDDLIEGSIARGGDLASAHCLRVVSYVVRQDLRNAKKALDAAKRAPASGPAGGVRVSIASACVQLALGQPRNAMIDALEALCAARSEQDGAGEAAALKMVSAACLAAGLETDADRLAHVAAAVAS
jgi:hypothetical protein